MCFGLHKKTVELSAAKEEKILPADTFSAFPNVKKEGNRVSGARKLTPGP